VDDRRRRQAVYTAATAMNKSTITMRTSIGVNAAGVAGVATPPNILTSVLFFFLNAASRCHFRDT